ncbi:MAG: deoxyribodipyrimidine photo-lyase, partial [Anaerolineales bacterium]|nr:deoxyribodipyrimidine photo-lyase [Anaerolineales bacterium]
RLIVRRGEPDVVLARLVAEFGVTAVFAEADITPTARRRDEKVAKAVPLHLQPGITVQHVDDVLKADGTPYTVFTSYMRRWKESGLPHHSSLLPTPVHIQTPAAVLSDKLPDILHPSTQFPAGEAEALCRLAAFAEGADAPVFRYAAARNMPGVDGTAQLSPYLRFGMVSARQAAVTAVSAMANAQTKEGRDGAETWLNELIWREFYQMILYHFPHVARRSFRPEYDRIEWQNDADAFAAWCNGRTGFPIVDAGMRQLLQTGWMHNRVRMIAASFLVKDLLVDWRWGERWFMQHLIDGDVAANNGGWQWSAGTGTDAAPYFRIFNPITQSKKFDPNGDYICAWVPELTVLPEKCVHDPSLLPPVLQQQYAFYPGENYPVPIVDRKMSRRRALDAYKAARAGGTGRLPHSTAIKC